ncbi:DUF4349 domain-containing protein [Aneurinibacillus danicus]|jgi:hypothetical protein|uniref:DUF4349 domain-containing protein n=1 Tax=Aneurinibacillus danicus TaxID=267746 RepID=A0A511VAI0_9BACL|nr:DUF4349 domain-containing protein [Aneurinibacillus danicus]GEN34908.1 hypothetical protein ADA01nite_23680 [Aneurinibacillus danicus]
MKQRKKTTWPGIGLVLILFLAACGAQNAKMESAVSDANPIRQADNAQSASSNEAKPFPSSEKTKAVSATMMVYNAELSLNVKDFATAQKGLTALVEKMDGYIVEAQSYTLGEGSSLLRGDFRARIPSAHFNTFLEQAEKLGVNVTNRTIQGRDVTEEYVDLEARLASKQVMENQLLGFMKKAQKTEDLLQIARDLNNVQTEIEQLKGKIKYLKNQSDFATVTIHMEESKAVLPSLSDNPVSTWDKTKQQFMMSIKFVLEGAATLFVFIVGTSPLLLVIGAIVAGIIYFKRRKKKNTESL